ncbi:hypothetical protein DL95DRAFT_453110 [Leptodontidium sp. 2 PMI_412]|nr:hypothetical protein DL95DRAFT_453110 [Leptodontidium sp. 2 PMI_412]
MPSGIKALSVASLILTATDGYSDQWLLLLFYSVANEASQDTLGEFQGFGPNALIYGGPNTTLTFENGTSLTYENQARILHRGSLNYNSSTTATPPLRRYAYPKQMTDAGERSIAGYYLDAPGYKDVAVLSVLDCSPDPVTAFQSIAEKFLARAKADKKKVIVDLSSSSGGYYCLPYDLFKHFFPQLSVLDYNRIRENEAFDIMTKIASGPKFDHYDARTATAVSKNFPSYQSKFGPIAHNGDQFTDIMRFSLSNPRISSKTDRRVRAADHGGSR